MLIVSLLLLVIVQSFGSAVPSTDCQAGWVYFRGSCYGFYDVPLPWHDASAMCRSVGGGSRLVEIDTEPENIWLVTKLKAINFGSIWIGSCETSHRGTFVWANSRRPFTYTDWSTGQPSDPPGIVEDCVEIRQPFGYKWNDYQCKEPNRYVCEASPIPH